MEGSWPITNQRQSVCLYFSPGCWVANLGPGQTDSPCRSPPAIRFPHCFDHKSRRTLLCPCLRHPPGRSSRLWNSRQQRSWKNKQQQVSIPTWGQMKSLCCQAQGMASLQGSSASPERVFIAMLAFTVLPGKCYLFYIRKILGIFPQSPDLPRSYLEQWPYTGQHRPASSLGRILYFL